MQRIDWADGAGYHIVKCERLRTIEGNSDISRNDLAQVAQPVRARDAVRQASLLTFSTGVRPYRATARAW